MSKGEGLPEENQQAEQVMAQEGAGERQVNNQEFQAEAKAPPPPPQQGDNTQIVEYRHQVPTPDPESEESGDEESEPQIYPTKAWCAFPQRIDTDGPPRETIWNTGDWELPYGSLQAGYGDQATIKLPDSFPPPVRMFLRVVSCWENDYHKSSAPGPQYQFSCLGRVSYRPKPDAGYVAHLLFRTTAWSAGLAPRFNAVRDPFHVVSGDIIEAFLKTDAEVALKNAIVRTWWPSTAQEWKMADPDGFWNADDVCWDFAKIYMLPRIAHDQLRPGNYKFEHTQAQVSYPTVFENIAQSVVKGLYGKYSKKPGKGTTQDDQGKSAAKGPASDQWTTTKGPATDQGTKGAGSSSDQWTKGTGKATPPDEWSKGGGGRWYEAAPSSLEFRWEYQQPVTYVENDWHEDYSKGGKWSPSWAQKGWTDYRTDKGTGYKW